MFDLDLSVQNRACVRVRISNGDTGGEAYPVNLQDEVASLHAEPAHSALRRALLENAGVASL